MKEEAEVDEEEGWERKEEPTSVHVPMDASVVGTLARLGDSCRWRSVVSHFDSQTSMDGSICTHTRAAARRVQVAPRLEVPGG